LASVGICQRVGDRRPSIKVLDLAQDRHPPEVCAESFQASYVYACVMPGMSEAAGERLSAALLS
jgi:hypothetical protein